eukprot:COSAG02_NODE_83_length_39665_cov_25.213719_35_plen_144_part_00
MLSICIHLNPFVSIESRKAERKAKVTDFKALFADVKLMKDDIIYLVAKMWEVAHEYARTTTDTQSLDMDDDEYELPDVKTSVLVGLPSNNRLRHTDTVAVSPALDRSVSSSATTSSKSPYVASLSTTTACQKPMLPTVRLLLR